MQINVDSLKSLERQVAVLLDGCNMTQESLAKLTKVDQGLISRLKNGQLRRMTPRLLRIWKYVNSFSGEIKQSQDLGGAIDAYLAAGGDPQLLVRQIDLLRSLLSTHARLAR